MTCQHQFNKIKEVTRPVQHMGSETGTIANRWDDESGAMVGCALCGEVRIIWEDGQIEITQESNVTTETKTGTDR